MKTKITGILLFKSLLKKHFLHMFFCLISMNGISQNDCKEIIGYFPNWQWYDRAKVVNPTSIQYSKYDILNYCFFRPEADGTITSTDTWADENLLKGQINWSTTPQTYYPNTSVIDLCHNAGKKIFVSIGGWTLSDNFPSIAASPVKRAAFAHSCNELIREYNFDGIDIDWEYPGYDHGGTPNDKVNFTILMQQIKDSLVNLGQVDNEVYGLSACFAADPAKMDAIEWSNVSQIVDCFNIMTYDYFGAWDAIANHNTPLHQSGSGNPLFSIEQSFITLTQTYNVPEDMINLGIAFYGRTQMGATALFQPTNGAANNVIFADDDGTPLYYNVMKNINLFDEFYDNVAESPYLLGKAGSNAQGTFVSYDNITSVAAKATYIKNMNARGTIIWEITGDYMETSPGSGVIGSTPLIDKINEVFCSVIQPSSVDEINSGESVFNVHPNPSSDGTILVQLEENVKIDELKVLDQTGRIVKYIDLKSNDLSIDISIEKSGVYFIQASSSKGISIQKIIIN